MSSVSGLQIPGVSLSSEPELTTVSGLFIINDHDDIWFLVPDISDKFASAEFLEGVEMCQRFF